MTVGDSDAIRQRLQVLLDAVEHAETLEEVSQLASDLAGVDRDLSVVKSTLAQCARRIIDRMGDRVPESALVVEGIGKWSKTSGVEREWGEPRVVLAAVLAAVATDLGPLARGHLCERLLDVMTPGWKTGKKGKDGRVDRETGEVTPPVEPTGMLALGLVEQFSELVEVRLPSASFKPAK